MDKLTNKNGIEITCKTCEFETASMSDIKSPCYDCDLEAKIEDRWKPKK